MKKVLKLTILTLCLINSPQSFSGEEPLLQCPNLNDFTTDGCSWFPDGVTWFNDADKEERTLWLKCCVDHDKEYWAGGTKDQKKRADLDFKQCVTDVTGLPWLGWMVYWGVSAGGTARIPTSFHWGYGWEDDRTYGPLLEEEKVCAEEKLSQIDEQAMMDEVYEMTLKESLGKVVDWYTN